jgi:hypothetical protein
MTAKQYNWFDKLLSAFLIIFSLGLFFGISGANNASIREIDASIGLINRPVTSKLTAVSKLLFSPVQVNAAKVAATIVGDIPRLLEQAVIKALKAALSALIKAFIGAIMKIFDQLLSAIEGWVGAIDGLKDVVASFRAAISLKAYKAAECLIQSSESIVDSFFPASADESNKTSNNPQDKCNGVFGASTGSEDTNALVAGVSNLRQQNLISESQSDVAEPLPNAPSKEELANKVQEFAANAAVLVGCGNSDNSLDNDPILPISRINVKNSSCSTVTNDIKQKTQSQLNSDVQTYNQLESNVTQEAPDACPGGYVGGLEGINSTSSAQQAANSVQTGDSAPADAPASFQTGDVGDVSTANFGNTAPAADFKIKDKTSKFKSSESLQVSEGAVGFSDSFDLETLNKEQCESANRTPVVTAATTSSSDQGQTEFGFDSIITAFIDAVTQFVSNLITKVFTILTEAINNFLKNAPGGEYLSQAIANIVDPLSNAIQEDLSILSDNLIDDLTN